MFLTIKELKKKYNKQSQELWSEKVKEINPDLEVKSIKDVRWTLDVASFSEEERAGRSENIQNFFAALEDARRELREEIKAELEAKIQEHNDKKLPPGFAG